MYALITYYFKDQTTKQEVVSIETMGSVQFALKMGAFGVQSITIDKYSKKELQSMGIHKTGPVEKKS